MGSVLAYFILTYGLAWSCWIALLNAGGSAPLLVRGLFQYTGIFAPALIAAGVTAQTQGLLGAHALLARVVEWRVDARWYLFAACYMAVIKLAAALLHRAITGGWPRFGNEAWYLLLVATILSTPFQAGEELGWRGAMPCRVSPRAWALAERASWWESCGLFAICHSSFFLRRTCTDSRSLFMCRR